MGVPPGGAARHRDVALDVEVGVPSLWSAYSARRSSAAPPMARGWSIGTQLRGPESRQNEAGRGLAGRPGQVAEPPSRTSVCMTSMLQLAHRQRRRREPRRRCCQDGPSVRGSTHSHASQCQHPHQLWSHLIPFASTPIEVRTRWASSRGHANRKVQHPPRLSRILPRSVDCRRPGRGNPRARPSGRLGASEPQAEVTGRASWPPAPQAGQALDELSSRASATGDPRQNRPSWFWRLRRPGLRLLESLIVVCRALALALRGSSNRLEASGQQLMAMKRVDRRCACRLATGCFDCLAAHLDELDYGPRTGSTRDRPGLASHVAPAPIDNRHGTQHLEREAVRPSLGDSAPSSADCHGESVVGSASDSTASCVPWSRTGCGRCWK